MANIIYKIGQEKDVILEKDNYNESIFKEQYENALRLISLYLDNINNKMLKSISFCGDRGDGKTSCMITVLDLLKNGFSENSPQHQFLISKNYDRIANTKIAPLDLIDPSFFDESHNVIELVVGQMYSKFKAIKDSEKYEDRNSLLTAFQDIKRFLCVLHDKNLDAISSMHELDILSSTIALRSRFENLVNLFLKYIGKDVLVIPIDDIDLNISQAYKMCEQIRKYLAVSNCIVLLAVKVDQLQSIIARTFKSFDITPHDQKESVANNDEYEIMAEKYIMKFLPTSSRVFMPKVYNLINSNIEIRQGNNVVLSSRALKDAVVDLIFRTTRYLFYNLQGNISPIVPNNLREYFILIGLLSSMKQISDSRDKNNKEVLESNKNKFKQYFFNVWMGRFNQDVQKKLAKLVNFDFGTSLNKEVVNILDTTLHFGLQKDYDQPKVEDFEIKSEEKSEPSPNEKGNTNEYKSPSRQIIESILSNKNFGYNVSVGDVFYLIANLEKETLQEEEYALIFFLKSFYSIKIYEAYDQVTEFYGHIYPTTDRNLESLSVIDHRFDCVNKLQQLIGGSYFTYSEGDLISLTQDHKTVDLRLLTGKELNLLLSSLKNEIDKFNDEDFHEQPDDKKNEIIKFNLKLNLAEFFIFTIKCAVRQKEFSRNPYLSAAINKMRANVDPFNYRQFTPYTGYYIFDVMAPFANIVNPEYAYRRFSVIDEDFYQKIRRQKGSLLNKMIDRCTSRQYVNHDEVDHEWTKLHRLLSDSVIRNADVLMSLKDNILLKRATTQVNAYRTLSNFYKQIESSGLATHKTSDEDKSYLISFHFLEPIYDLLKILVFPRFEHKADEPKLDLSDYNEIIDIFNNIFGQDNSKEIENPLPSLKEVKNSAGASRTSTTIMGRLLESSFGPTYQSEIKNFFSHDVNDKVIYKTLSKRDARLKEFLDYITPTSESVSSEPLETETDPTQSEVNAASQQHQQSVEAEGENHSQEDGSEEIL